MPPRGTRKPKDSKLATVGIIVFARPIRQALVASLAGRNGFIAVDLGDGGEESLRRLAHVRPQALLVDLPRSRLAALLRRVHAGEPRLPLLAVNCDEEESELLALFEAGLTGFVPHDATDGDLVRAVRDALVGEFHCPPRIAAALVRRVNAAGELQGRAASFEALTPREEEIARLLECAMTNKAIAARLGIGTETVRNHVYRICRKLDAHRRTEIAPRLRERGPELRVIRGRRPQEE
jgi:DNA-binding NarL/FixJ family response regulator